MIRGLGFASFFLSVIFCPFSYSLPRFLFPDSELEVLWNDLFVRHLRADFGEGSLRKEGVPVLSDGMTYQKEWELIATGWFDASQMDLRVRYLASLAAGKLPDATPDFPHEDVSARIVDSLNRVPVDRFGYVWSGPDVFEDSMLGPGIQASQGRGYPSYLESRDRIFGMEWNIPETSLVDRSEEASWMEGWSIPGAGWLRATEGFLEFSTGPPSTCLISPRRSLRAEDAPFIEMDVELVQVVFPDGKPRQVEIQWIRRDNHFWSQDKTVRSTVFATAAPVQMASGERRRILFPMYLHPEWKGEITEMRFKTMSPWNRRFGHFKVNYVRMAYDTRQAVNNSHFILAAWRYYLWSGDEAFLNRNSSRMRRALLFLNQHLGGAKLGYLDQSLFFVGQDDRGMDDFGNPNVGHGIGTGYWKNKSTGPLDFEANLLYLRALRIMAQLEKTRPHRGRGPEIDGRTPGTKIAWTETADSLETLADRVEAELRSRFWSPETGRFVEGIGSDSGQIDYGNTILNLMAVAEGPASASEAKSIFEWLDGLRIVAEDTSSATDIYFWRLAPRTTTRKNERHYAWPWIEEMQKNPSHFGEQVHDGGAVLWASYYDILARIRSGRTDSAWEKLKEIAAWHREILERGGKGPDFYQEVYFSEEARDIGSSRGELLRGERGTGGLGLDGEFIENAILPAVIVHGFLGISPTSPGELTIQPRIPDSLPYLGAEGIRYQGSNLKIMAATDAIDLTGSEISSQARRRLRLCFPSDSPETRTILKDGEFFQGDILIREGKLEVLDVLSAARYEMKEKQE